MDFMLYSPSSFDCILNRMAADDSMVSSKQAAEILDGLATSRIQ
jgi:hypothetical protein